MHDPIINIVYIQGTVSGPPPQLYQPEFQKQLIEQQKQQQLLLEQQKHQQLLEQQKQQQQQIPDQQQLVEQQQLLEKQKQQIMEQQLQQQIQHQQQQQQIHQQQQLISSSQSQPLQQQIISTPQTQQVQQQIISANQTQQQIISAPQPQPLQQQMISAASQPQQIQQQIITASQPQQMQQQMIPASQPQPLPQQIPQPMQQQVISASQPQQIYYQPIIEQPNIVYQQQPPKEVVYQQPPAQAQDPTIYQSTQQKPTVIEAPPIISQPNVIYQQQQQQMVEQQPQPNVVYHQPTQPAMEKPNVVYQQQPVLEQPNVVYQQQQVVEPGNVIYQQKPTEQVIYQQQPLPGDQVIFKPQDVGQTQQPNVQYIPVVVPLEPKQQIVHSEQEPVPVPASLPVVQEPADPFARKILEVQKLAAQGNEGVPVEAPQPNIVAPQLETVQQQHEKAALSPAAVVHNTNDPSSVDRDKVSCVLSQFGACTSVPKPALPLLKLDLSSVRQQPVSKQLEDAANTGWVTAPIMSGTLTLSEAELTSRASRRGSLPVPQQGSLLAPPRLAPNSSQNPTKAHSAESSPKRISSIPMSTYSSIAHKLPFPSQSLRRRSADPSELICYKNSSLSGSNRTSPTSLTPDDLGLLSLLEQRRASGGSSVLSPVWENRLQGQYNMMTIREVISLCGSTTSLASTQVSSAYSQSSACLLLLMSSFS